MSKGLHNASYRNHCDLAERQVAELPEVIRRFWPKVAVGAATECWLWQGGRSGEGYGSFRIGRHRMGAHRVAWSLTYGPIPDGADILHSCDVKRCCNPSHLSPGTHTDNMRDASARGLLAVPHPTMPRKLTTEQVSEILTHVARNGRGAITEMARKHGVSQPLVSMIVRGARRQYDSIERVG